MNAGSFQLAMVVPSPDYPDILFCQQMEQFGKPFFVLKLGAKSAVVKTGEYGAMLFHKDGFFTICAYPVRSLHDPTGAGDSFAGALTGYLAKCDSVDFNTLKEAMIVGSAVASITVESFSCYKLEKAGLAEIEARVKYIKEISQL